MNWARGMLRAWLVISSLWLVPMLAMTIHYWPDSCCDPWTHQVTDPALLPKLEDKPGKTADNAHPSTPAARPRGNGPIVSPAVQASNVTSLSDEALVTAYLQKLEPWERNSEKGQLAKDTLAGIHRRHVMKTLLSITFLPPLALLALGLAAFWVARGFREGPSR